MLQRRLDADSRRTAMVEQQLFRAKKDSKYAEDQLADAYENLKREYGIAEKQNRVETLKVDLMTAQEGQARMVAGAAHIAGQKNESLETIEAKLAAENRLKELEEEAEQHIGRKTYLCRPPIRYGKEPAETADETVARLAEDAESAFDNSLMTKEEFWEMQFADD